MPELVFYGVQFLAFQNLWWSVANLLPVRPLDGGNVVTEIFGIDRARKLSIALRHRRGGLRVLQRPDLRRLLLPVPGLHELPGDPRRAGGRRHGRLPRRRARRARRHADARSRANLSVVEPGAPHRWLAPDPARAQHLAWAALKQGDVPAAKRLTKGLGPGADPFLKAATALASGDKQAFQLFEDAYVAVPSGPSNLIATEVLARTGAAVAVARRLVERPDGKGREGAGTLQTHLHYADCFAEAAEVGTVVYAADPPSKAQTAFEVACSWAKATDVDHAIEWLERAADDGFRAASLVDGEPDLEAVRADPRWPLLRARGWHDLSP